VGGTKHLYTPGHLAGHSGFGMTRRYVHPQANSILEPMQKAQASKQQAG